MVGAISKIIHTGSRRREAPNVGRLSRPTTAPTRQLTAKPARSIEAASATVVVPAIIANAGEHATRSFREFFATTIHNRNTRSAYLHAVNRFFAWCEHHKPGRLADIKPLHVVAYIKALGKHVQKPTVKQHLAAIRMLFGWLVTSQVIATNPVHAVRGPRYVVKTGKTTVLDVGQVRKFLDSIDSSSVVGLRDRALISVMTFAFARIGAVVAMRVEDYYPNGKHWWVRLNEKGGTRHEMPAHETLKANLEAYIDAAGLRDGGKAPLFRTAAGCSGTLTEKPISPVDVWRMIQRRAAFVGMNVRIGCHTFRATGIRAYLEGGGTLEDARVMAAHVSPRTTKLYDCTGDALRADEREREDLGDAKGGPVVTSVPKVGRKANARRTAQ
jgi:site-specific recombinase XerD